MENRNHQIHAERGYDNFFNIIEITMLLVITETQAESMFCALIIAYDLIIICANFQTCILKHDVAIQEKLNRLSSLCHPVI